MTYAVQTPLSIERIRDTAAEFRKMLKLKKQQPFPTLRLLEYLNNVNAEKDKETLRIVEDEELPQAHGTYSIDHGIVTLRNSCYRGALNGDPECLFTTNHEFAHFILHSQSILHRMDPSFEVPDEMCPEVQADSFAIELTIDHEYLRKCLRRQPADSVADKYQIPRQKLDEHIARLVKAGLLEGQQLSLGL